MNAKLRTPHSTQPHYDEKDAFARLERAREDKNDKAFFEIRNEIMLANGGLVRVLAKKACRYYGLLGLSTTCWSPNQVAVFSEDDFMQHGYILLDRAIRNFDRSAGVRFSTYATTVVGRGLNQVFNARALKKYVPRGFISLDADVDNERGRGKLGDFLPDKTSAGSFEQCFRKDVRRTLAAALLSLTKREQKVVLLSQGLGCEKRKQAEIAKLLGVTPQRVTQILKGAFRKLQELPAIQELRHVG